MKSIKKRALQFNDRYNSLMHHVVSYSSNPRTQTNKHTHTKRRFEPAPHDTTDKRLVTELEEPC